MKQHKIVSSLSDCPCCKNNKNKLMKVECFSSTSVRVLAPVHWFTCSVTVASVMAERDQAIWQVSVTLLYSWVAHDHKGPSGQTKSKWEAQVLPHCSPIPGFLAINSAPCFQHHSDHGEEALHPSTHTRASGMPRMGPWVSSSSPFPSWRLHSSDWALALASYLRILTLRLRIALLLTIETI